jgi:hypothetical protein
VPAVDADLVRRICGTVALVDTVYDSLDGTIWVVAPTATMARSALTVLNAFGVGGHDLEDGRLHVTGWDRRLLHWRLGGLLAAVDDLGNEWAGTADLVCYHHDRRVAAGVDPEVAEILADVEDVIRGCVPIPHAATRTDDVGVLLDLIAAANDAYEQLIAEHVDYAEQVLAAHVAWLHPGAA